MDISLRGGKSDKHISLSFLASLKACTKNKDLCKGRRIHAEICNSGLLKKYTYLGNTLVNMYAKCAAFERAKEVLDELHDLRNVVSWNALITGYAEHGQCEKAFGCLRQMRKEGLCPDEITYACILKACGIVQDSCTGKRIHCEIAGQGLLERSVILHHALIDMYAKCGEFSKAKEVLDDLPAKDEVSWCALIAGYAQHGRGEEALRCFEWMRRDGLSPDAITYACILKACGIMQEADIGREIHDEIVSHDLVGKNVVLGTALVDMYAKCGLLAKAQKVVNELPLRDVVTWNTIIAGYAQQGQREEVLECLMQMRNEGLSPNAITYACIVKVCGATLEADMGKKFHDEITSQGILGRNIVLGTALVDMYAKCGVLSEAQKVLKELPVRNIVTWNALIAGFADYGMVEEALECLDGLRSEGFSPDIVSWSTLIGGYAQQGRAEEAFDCFERMQRAGISPTAATLVGVLNACSHAGLIDEGQKYFKNMKGKYDVIPDKEHHTCMVDLFGRAKHFDKALRVITEMPFPDHPPVWSALLGASGRWGDLEFGRLAFEHGIQLSGHNAAAYILMANIYAAAIMKEDAEILDV